MISNVELVEEDALEDDHSVGVGSVQGQGGDEVEEVEGESEDENEDDEAGVGDDAEAEWDALSYLDLTMDDLDDSDGLIVGDIPLTEYCCLVLGDVVHVEVEVEVDGHVLGRGQDVVHLRRLRRLEAMEGETWSGDGCQIV